jgi:hypothetical protein
MDLDAVNDTTNRGAFMNKSIIATILLLLSLSAYGQSGPGGYFSVGGGLLSFDDGYDSVEPIQLLGRLGYDFTPNIGIGVEAGFSLIEDDLYGVDYAVDTVFFYLKGSIPLSNNDKLYGMIGPTNVELTGSIGNISASADDDDTGMGFGYEKALGGGSAFSIDYIIYNDNSGVDVTSINFCYVGHF